MKIMNSCPENQVCDSFCPGPQEVEIKVEGLMIRDEEMCYGAYLRLRRAYKGATSEHIGGNVVIDVPYLGNVQTV